MWEIASRLKPWSGLMQVQVVVAVGLRGDRLPAVTATVATEEPEWADFNTLMRDAMNREPGDRKHVYTRSPLLAVTAGTRLTDWG